jgi:hypothetical protein
LQRPPLCANRPTMDHVSSLAEMKMRFMRASTMLYLAYLVFVSILSCIIVFMWWSTTKLIRQNSQYYAIELRDCLGS